MARQARPPRSRRCSLRTYGTGPSHRSRRCEPGGPACASSPANGRLADVAVDAVDVLDDGHAASGFSEIEVELIDGDEGDLDRLSRVLRRAGAHASHGTPKLLRVLDLNGERSPSKKAPAAEQLRFLLAHQLLELERHDPGVRLGAEPEDLHEFRVATRRARALIRASKPLLGAQLERSGMSSAGWAGRSGPSATSTSRSRTFRASSMSSATTARGRRRSSRCSRNSAREAHELLLEAPAQRPVPRVAESVRAEIALRSHRRERRRAPCDRRAWRRNACARPTRLWARSRPTPSSMPCASARSGRGMRQSSPLRRKAGGRRSSCRC